MSTGGATPQYVRLGGSGLHVSPLCLGMMGFGTADAQRPWVVDESVAEPMVKRALDAGVNFFDTADVYSGGTSEEVTGRLLLRLTTREEVVIATKVNSPTTPGPNGRGLSRKHLMAAIDASLQRLGVDYVDLYQVHRWDPHTPIEETMEALHDIVKAGKARYLGASSMAAWQFAKAQRVAERHGWTRFTSIQPYYNLLYREEERETIPQAIDQGVGVIPWSPLARGVLAGTRSRSGQAATTRAATDPLIDSFYEDADFDVVDALRDVAEGRGVPPAQVALAWVRTRPGITAPIVGATKRGHIEDAIASLSIALTTDEVAALEARYRPHPVLGYVPSPPVATPNPPRGS